MDKLSHEVMKAIYPVNMWLYRNGFEAGMILLSVILYMALIYGGIVLVRMVSK